MKIQELLLPKNVKDLDLSAKSSRRIDLLQKRMDSYVDKIKDPSTSSKGKDFLKAKLKTDYNELKDAISEVVAESADAPVQYEIYVSRTGEKVKAGPYSTAARARNAVDKLDNKHGSYKYAYRPIKQLNEAIHKLPLTDDDFELVKQLMTSPIPAVVAPIYIQEIIDDDEFNDMLSELSQTKPGMDVRQLVAEWIDRVMPDQKYRFTDTAPTTQQRQGQMSVIHGYNTQSHVGTNDPITGDAYGSK